MSEPIQTLKEATDWYDHIELAGVFVVGCYIVGKIIGTLIERWLSPTICKDCPDIKRKQEDLRNITLPALRKDIADIKTSVAVISSNLELIMRGLHLEPIKWEGPDRRAEKED